MHTSTIRPLTIVVYDADTGWSVSYHNHMDDNILAKGALDSRDLYDCYPIQKGMNVSPMTRPSTISNTAIERGIELCMSAVGVDGDNALFQPYS